MWLLSFIPDWIIHAGVIFSALGLLILPFFQTFSLLNSYRTVVNYLLIFVLALTIFTEGVMANQAHWEKEVLKKDLQISQLETKAATKTVEVIEKVVTKVIHVKGETKEIVNNVPVYITKEADSKCDVPNAFVQLHDMAAKGEFPNPTPVPDAGTSEIKLSGVASTVFENYGTCQEIREKYIGLQNWVREQEKISKQ